jgi:hypothetical protein
LLSLRLHYSWCSSASFFLCEINIQMSAMSSNSCGGAAVKRSSNLVLLWAGRFGLQTLGEAKVDTNAGSIGLRYTFELTSRLKLFIS